MKKKLKYISRRQALNFLGSAGLILYLPQFAQASTEMVSGVIEEIIDGKNSVVLMQAKNRMYIQQAILIYVLKK